MKQAQGCQVQQAYSAINGCSLNCPVGHSPAVMVARTNAGASFGLRSIGPMRIRALCHGGHEKPFPITHGGQQGPHSNPSQPHSQVTAKCSCQSPSKHTRAGGPCEHCSPTSGTAGVKRSKTTPRRSPQQNAHLDFGKAEQGVCYAGRWRCLVLSPSALNVLLWTRILEE